MDNVINFNKEANDTKETWLETRFMIGHLTEEEAQTKTREILNRLSNHLFTSGDVPSSYYSDHDGNREALIEVEDIIEDSWKQEGEIKELRHIQTVIGPVFCLGCAADREAYDYE
jgi:hypothetical protein